MINYINKFIFLLNKKFRKKFILIFILMVLGAFMEMLGIGIVLPILNILVEGRESLQNTLANLTNSDTPLSYFNNL